MPTTPPSITPLPTPPDPNDRATFNTRAYPWSVAQQTFAAEVGAVAANVFANANEADADATTATTKANEAAASALAAAASASSAINAPGTSATSTTSLSLTTGSKAFTIQTGKAFSVGQTVVIARTSDAVKQMAGVITAHDSSTGAITVHMSFVAGAGTFADWTVALGTAGGLPDTAGNDGKYLGLASGAPIWVTITQPTLKPFSAGRTLLTTSGSTFTVPAGVTSIRPYLFGKGGNGSTSSLGGGGGSCTWGTVPVNPGDVFTFAVVGNVASLKNGATTYFTANAGTNASGATPGAGGAVGAIGAGLGITSSGTSAGGGGGNSGGASGSPIGTGGFGASSGGGGWGGQGSSGANGGGGGVGADGSSTTSGGAGPAGPYGSGNARPGRDYTNVFADPLLEPCVAPGVNGIVATSGTALAIGLGGGPGAGGGKHDTSATGTEACGGFGGLGGGGGSAIGSESYGGNGGFGGGGGLGITRGGNGGVGGGGGGSSTTGGTGGSAAVLIFF